VNLAPGKTSCNLLIGIISATVTAATLGALSGCSVNSPKIATTAGTTATTTGTGSTTTGGVVTFQYDPPLPGFSVYAFQSPSTGDASILQFAASSSGSVAPSSTLTLPTPQSISWDGMTTDRWGQIYAWGNQIASSPSEILVYPAGGTTPVHTILGSPSTFPFTSQVVVDSTGQIYVETGDAAMGNSAILVYSTDADGTTTPVRTIEGSLTGLDGSGFMAVDGAGNIYISNDTNTPGEIRVFAPTANGNVAPTRVIAGANTLLTTWVLGLDVDSIGDVYAVVWLPATNSTEIVEFAAGASGNVAPIMTLDGAIAGEQAINVRVDAAGNLYALCEGLPAIPPATVSPFIAVFSAPVASGATPARQFSSPAWTAPTGNFALY
jgi:hypothetical protein